MREALGVAAGYTCDVLRPQESVRQLIKLGRQVLPETIVQEYSPRTRAVFDTGEEHPKLLIAAYNEEGDLPTALLSLAMSDEPLHPVVVNNASTDRTAEFAEEMGATVWECAKRGKGHALKHAFERLNEEGGTTQLFFTDADAILPPAWTRHMKLQLDHPDMEFGGVACGSVVFYHDRRPVLQGVKSLHTNFRNWQHVKKGGPKSNRANGNNMAVASARDGSNDVVEDLAQRYDGGLIIVEDKQVAEIAKGTEGVLLHTFDREGVVYARGDRVPTWTKLVLARINKGTGYAYEDWKAAGEEGVSVDEK